MQKTLLYKFITIIGLCGLFLFGLMFVSNLVSERQRYYATVMADIEKTHVRPQSIATPFIVVPTSQGVLIPQFSHATHVESQVNVSDNDYKRGIYKAISYTDNLQFSQQYQLKSLFSQPAPVIKKPEPSEAANSEAGKNPDGTVAVSQQAANQQATTQQTISQQAAAKDPVKKPTQTKATETVSYMWQNAKLIIPVSDLRGITSLPAVVINGQTLSAQFPKQGKIEGFNYIEVDLTPLANDTQRQQLQAQADQNQAMTIEIKMDVAGIHSLSVLPLGEQFDFSLQSNWTQPKFYGDALPTKNFTPTGFTATWQNQFLALSNTQRLTDCLLYKNNCQGLTSGSMQTNYSDSSDSREYGMEEATSQASSGYQWMSTAFVDSNNTYTQTDRTLKYALLLLLVSFGTFFLFEILKQLRIHPIQYGLVAAALLVFYVLLLSFAEQIAFWQAYSIATLACVGLIGWYASFVLHSIKRALGFSVILGGLYAGFYLILASEDMNLLLGAIFCFVLLAIVMYLTRKIDWYQVNAPTDTAPSLIVEVNLPPKPLAEIIATSSPKNNEI